MALGRTVTDKEAMASRRTMFLDARDRTHGKEENASRRAEFITASGRTSMWADFDAAMAEWAVDLEAAKPHRRIRKGRKQSRKEIPAIARKKKPHAMVRRAWPRLKHGGLPPTRH